MAEYLYHFVPGDRPELATEPDAWTPDDEAISASHFEYLQSAAEAGTVVLAGRSQDGIGPAIVIIEAEDDGAARQFMENDPFVSSGLFRANLHPFRTALKS